jgi:imidazolonepropionase-like amidohydrolase
MIDLTIASKVWNCPTFTFELILSSQKNIDDYLATPEATYLLDKDFKFYNERTKIPWASNFSEQDFNNTVPSLKNRFDFVNKLHKRGGLLLAGTDADVYGPSLHRELKNLSACGLSNYDVLKTATINPAIYFGIQKDYGTVEKNKIADLVILEQNPIENINNTQSIFAVIQNGKLISNEEIIKKKKELKTIAGKSDFKLRR